MEPILGPLMSERPGLVLGGFTVEVDSRLFEDEISAWEGGHASDG